MSRAARENPQVQRPLIDFFEHVMDRPGRLSGGRAGPLRAIADWRPPGPDGRSHPLLALLSYVMDQPGRISVAGPRPGLKLTSDRFR